MPSLPILADRGPAPKPASLPHRAAVRLYRAAALVAAAWLVHAAYARSIPPDPPRRSLGEARLIFPTAERLVSHDAARNADLVADAAGETLGFVLTTSPETDDLVGYSGPSNLLVGLDPQGKVVGVRLIASDDTPAHVAELQRSESFWQSFVGWSAAEPNPPKVDAVGGSTLTALAMAEAVQQRLAGRHFSLRFPEPVTLDEVRGCFAGAESLVPDRPRAGWLCAQDARGGTLGYVLRTSPQSDNIRGYGGPTESLVAIASDQSTIVALNLRKTYDTPEYVDRLREDDHFLKLPEGKSIAEWAAIDFKKAKIEGVSGATQTSFAVMQGLKRRLAADVAAASAPPATTSSWKLRDLGLAAVVLGALAMAFTRLKGHPRLRLAWQAVLMVGFGWWFGDLLSIALSAGWARHGIPWQTSPALVLLVVVSLVIPWGTRRQIYCHQLCPHGAAQEWLGRVKRWRISLPASLGRILSFVPFVLLAVSFALALAAPAFDLTQLEPFDAWSLKLAAVVSSVIAGVGLVASLFLPQAYCRFGCPTGALLKLIRAHGPTDRFGLGDALIVAVLIGGAGFLGYGARRTTGEQTGPGSSPETSPTPQPPLRFAGEAFGTTWSIKFRQPPSDPKRLRDALAAELERIESRLSHWRATSETSQFNSSATTLALEFSPELIELVARGRRLAESTDGAFDLTVAPLVDAWGYGPSGKRAAPPSDSVLGVLLGRVGYQKLDIDVPEHTLKKAHPELAIDLGAFLQGYAADRMAAILEKEQAGEFLIDVGGELVARGAWNVAVENPADPGRPLRTIVLRDAALATSGIYRRSSDGKPQTRHILSPRTGQPVAAQWQLVAVVRPSGIEADGWSTALLAVASDKSLAIADRDGIAVLLVDEAGKVSLSKAGEDVFGGK